MVTPRTCVVVASRCVLVALAMLALNACGDESDRDDADGEARSIRIATTVAPITSIVSSIAGDRATVTGIVPEGTNSHTYEPRPSTAELLSTVDVIYVNGLQLEEPTTQLARQNMRDDAEILELGTQVLPESQYIYDFSFPRAEGKPNPHLWTDPTYAKRYARLVADDLSTRDPSSARTFEANYEAFAKVVDSLDAAMRASFASIPREERSLLTYHDAFAYFARTYGWTVLGAIQVSDFADPTPKEVAALVEQVRSSGVQAIFGSEVFPSPVLEQIGEEADVTYVDTLRDDDLPGEPGDAEHSWAGLMQQDYITITEALGGDAGPLRALALPAESTDGATYPQ